MLSFNGRVEVLHVKVHEHLRFLLLIFSNQSITSSEFFHCLSMDLFLMIVMCFCRMVLDSLPKWVLDELIVLQLISCGKFALWSLIERNASLISYFGTLLFFKLICLFRIWAASLLIALIVFSLSIEYSLVMLFLLASCIYLHSYSTSLMFYLKKLLPFFYWVGFLCLCLGSFGILIWILKTWGFWWFRIGHFQRVWACLIQVLIFDWCKYLQIHQLVGSVCLCQERKLSIASCWWILRFGGTFWSWRESHW